VPATSQVGMNLLARRQTATSDTSHGRTVVDPRLVAPGLEDAGLRADRIEHLAVGAAANRVGGDQPGALQSPGRDLCRALSNQ
jgi:hypothetical protein